MLRIIWTIFFALCALSLEGQIKSTNSLIPTSSNSANTLSYQIRSLRELGTFIPTADTDSTFVYAKRAIDDAVKDEDSFKIALAKRTMGEVFYLQGVYDYSTAYLSEALIAFRQLGNRKEEAKTMLSIGAASQFHDMWDDALSQYRAALEIYEFIGDTSGLAESYGLIGHFFEKNAEYDSAFFYQYEALKIYDLTDDYNGKAIIYDNLGSIFEDLGNFERAYDYFMLSAKFDSLSNNEAALVNTLNNIGDTFRKRWNYDSAIIYTNKALRMAIVNDLNYEVLSAYNDMAKLNRAYGYNELALTYYDSANEFSQILFNSQIASQIANFQTLYKTKEKEQEINLLEAKQQIAQQTRNSLIVGSIFLVFTASIIISQMRARRKREKAFFEAERSLDNERFKNDALERQKLTAELENKRLKEEQFYHELESRSQDLTAKTLHIIQKNRVLKELQKEVQGITIRDKTKVLQLQKIGNLIDESFEFDRDWEEFQRRFDQVHANFLSRINFLHPHLTDSEIRLSTLIRMKLSSKDIATILGISQDSLRISRYRLKKKLSLEKSQNLKEYLEHLN